MAWDCARRMTVELFSFAMNLPQKLLVPISALALSGALSACGGGDTTTVVEKTVIQDGTGGSPIPHNSFGATRLVVPELMKMKLGHIDTATCPLDVEPVTGTVFMCTATIDKQDYDITASVLKDGAAVKIEKVTKK